MQNSTIEISTPWAEVFSTNSGSVHQSDQENCWYVDFNGKVARFDYRCMLKLKKAIYNLNVEELLMNSSKSADLEIVFICACDHFYILSIMEIIEFKELLEGTFVMLNLNQMLHDCLYRIPVN